MIELLGHRGPDEAGYFLDRRAAMCATRLRINDLVRGQQPLADESERFWIVYNGEIYNHLELRRELEGQGHRFHSTCDTEVALRAWQEWGCDAPARFEGGFAFAIYDRRDATAYLVRDQFGKRPLFHRQDGDRLVFGSEMKVFLARDDLPFRWDGRRLAALFTRWTPFGSETPFEGIEQVPAGAILTATPAGISTRRYAEFPFAEASASDSVDEAAERTTALLKRAVELRLRSDVEVGVLLSGGLDSSIVAHLVHARQPGKMQSFSISFADEEFDESFEQDLVAKAFGMTHHRLRVSSADVAEAFPAALWHAEIPQFRTALVPMFLLSRRIRDAGVKVVLSGEGADEVFFGYDVFKETRLRESWAQWTPEERRERIRGLYPYLKFFSDANVRALETVFAKSVEGERDRLFSHALRIDNGRFAARMLNVEATDGDELTTELEARFRGIDAPGLRRAQWIEFHTLLQGYLLSSQGDRMAFAHGVEPRCPFLSPAVVSYAASLPVDHHLPPDDNEKAVLKRAFRDVLPPRILTRPKQPYRAPGTAAFFAAPGRFLPWVDERLAEPELRRVGPLNAEHALRLAQKIRGTPSERISPREDQAFLLLMSLLELDRLFVRREGMSLRRAAPPLTQTIDRVAP